MKFFELIKYRRSIRKYEDRQIPRADLEKIIEAGLFAPNAGGGQRAIIRAIYNKELCEQIGKLNISKFAFCCATNMTLAAAELGIASCIVARGEDTFDNETGAALLKDWDVPDNYIARCFVLLGYCKGEYPSIRPRKENRMKIIEG